MEAPPSQLSPFRQALFGPVLDAEHPLGVLQEDLGFDLVLDAIGQDVISVGEPALQVQGGVVGAEEHLVPEAGVGLSDQHLGDVSGRPA